MDPNANLREQERIMASMPTIADQDERLEQLDRLWDLRMALHEWMNAGGFEPDWSIAPLAAQYYGRD